MPRQRRRLKLSFNENITELLQLIQDDTLITFKAPPFVQELIVSFSIGFNHYFDADECHKNITVQNDNKTAKLKKKDGWSRRVHCDKIMKTGIHFIEFEIDNFQRHLA